jgi:FolB domain-containing protein
VPQVEFAPPLHVLRIDELILSVRLGCLEDERAKPQEVRLSAEFRFHEAPKGIWTDEINDTICYGKLSEALRKHAENREFRLIERLAQECYVILKEFAKGQAAAAVRIHKVKPPVEKLLGGSTYVCGDFHI